MQRIMVWKLAVVCIVAALVGLPLAGQQDMQDTEIEVVKVSDGIYMLLGRGGNIGLSVGEDGAFLVDDQFAPLTEKIQAAVRSVTSQPIRFVLNTHWHGDHTGGNENLGKAGALIVAHENVRKRLNPKEFREVMGRTEQANPEALPVVTFSDTVNFYWNDEKIHAFHVREAHTDGDAIIHFTRANVIHMGDIFFHGRYPFIDVDSGGGVQGVIAAVERVLAMVNSATKIIPGHGVLCGSEELRAYRDMLIQVRDRIQTMVNDGRTEDEVVAAQPTRDLDEKWGERSERLVRAVYRSLAGK